MASQDLFSPLAVFPQEILDLIFEEVYLLETDALGRSYFDSLNSASLLNRGSYEHARRLRFKFTRLTQTKGPGSSERLLQLIRANPVIADDICSLFVQEKCLDGVWGANQWAAQATTIYTDRTLGTLLRILPKLSALYLTGLNPAWVASPEWGGMGWRQKPCLPFDVVKDIKDNVAALQSGLSNIEHLRLQYLAVDAPSDFTSLLASYPNLRSLELMNIDIREITDSDELTGEIEIVIRAYEMQALPWQASRERENVPYYDLPVGILDIHVPEFLAPLPQIQCLYFRAQFVSDMVLLEYILGSSPIFPNLERLTLRSGALNADTYELLMNFLRVPSIRKSLKSLDLSKFVIGTRQGLPAEGLPLPSGLSDLSIIIPVDSRIQASACRSMLVAIAQTISMRASDPDAVPLDLSLRFDIKYFYWDVDLRGYLDPEDSEDQGGEETDDGAELAQALFADGDSDDEEYEPLADNLSQGSSSDDDDVDAIVGANEFEFCCNQMLLPSAVSTLDGTIADAGLNLQGLDVEFVNHWGAIIRDDLDEAAFWDTFEQEFPATAALFRNAQ